ncbi:alpha/beta fold hydrolase [Bradyrhizobium erythrophlei]|uniref:alpha/beta fold hydrolase n=1 Tax=Bradyrhizobium erythrophlei TaxID=1437360 RepID=UPI0035E7DDE5
MFDLKSSPLARRSFLGASVGAMAAGFAAQALPALAQTPTDVPSNFFPGFRRHTIQTSGTTINVLVGGNGPPILLLHGYPQTHVEWRKIAPQLSANYTVVIPDLRGYGDSGKPEDGDNHINYSKRAMALDQVEVMEQLGFKQFAMVSHDRGARRPSLGTRSSEQAHQTGYDGHHPHLLHVQDDGSAIRLCLFSLVLPYPSRSIS